MIKLLHNGKMIKKAQWQNDQKRHNGKMILLLVLPELLLGLDGSEHDGRELGGNCLQQNNHQVSNNTSTTLYVKSGFGFRFQSAFCSYWPLFSSKKSRNGDTLGPVELNV